MMYIVNNVHRTLPRSMRWNILQRAKFSTTAIGTTNDMNMTMKSTLQSSSSYNCPSYLYSKIRTMSSFQETRPILEKITVKVPSLGDSITEGTVVEWAVKEGQSVKVDDVVALIETDKVTVDIKAQLNGVVLKHFVELDQDVEVGKKLYMIDTEAEASGSAVSAGEIESSEIGKTEVPVQGEKMEHSVSSSAKGDNETKLEEQESTGQESGVRIPSIHFLGKKGWWEKRLGGGKGGPENHIQKEPAVPMAAAASQQALKPNAAITIQGGPLPSSYGRTQLTEREIEDLGLGGAVEAPYSY